MTKYVGVAKGSRTSRAPGHTAQDRRVALAMYSLTGAHPEQEDVTAGTAVEAAPEPACPLQAHFTFAIDGVPFGEPVVVQLLDDEVPASAREFRARAVGATGRAGQVEYEGATVACVRPALRVDVGAPASATAGKPKLEDARLRHDSAGLVSMSTQSARCSFTLQACPELDGHQQVVGRVVSGTATLEELSKLEADADGVPSRRALVCSCGVIASATALPRTLAVATEVSAQLKARQYAEKAETPAETRARLERESAASRGAVEDAVRQGALERGKKRKLADGAGAGRGRMLDALLGGDGSSADEDSDDDGAS